MPRKATATAKKLSSAKTATLKVPKKRTAAKVAKKTVTAKVPAAPKAEQAFWVMDGRVLMDMAELATALAAMENSVFSHHVNKEKNDFAEWVEHVLADVECAAGLRKSRTQKSAHTVVIRRLRIYQ